MRANKVLLKMVLLLLIVIGVAACSNNAVNNEVSKTNEQNNNESATNKQNNKESIEQVEIRVAWWGGVTRNELYDQIVANFEKEYPHIKVSKEPTGDFNDYFSKLITQTAGGNAPDVIHMHWTRVVDFAKRGTLLNLNEMTKSGQIDLQYFKPSVIDAGVIDGNNYMVALGNSISGLFYNKTLFEDLGVPLPHMNWTWEEFIETSKALKTGMKSDNMWATDITGNHSGVIRNYFRQQGKDLFSEDGKLGFAKDDLVKFWTMWEELSETEAIPDPATMNEYAGKSTEESLMVKGRVAMVSSASNRLKIYQKSMPDAELDIVRIPSTPGGQNGEFLEGAYLSIYEKSKHKDEAALFIDFMINSEESIKIFQLEQGSLGSSKMNEFVSTMLEPVGIKEIEFVSEVSQYASPLATDPASGAQVLDALNMNYEALRFDKKTVQQAVDDFFTEANKIMN